MSTSTLSVNARTEPALQPAWRGFAEGPWTDEIDVRDFLQRNYTPYTGDASFLAGPTAAHDRDVGAADRDVPGRARARRPRRRPAHAVDDHVARARLHRPRTTSSSSACRRTRPSSARSCPTAATGWSRRRWRPTASTPDPIVGEIFTKYRKTHNDGVFDVYPPDVRAARSAHLITGSAGRLRARPDHRRLPPRRPVRRRRADRRQAPGPRRARPRALVGGRHPRPRGERRADPRAGRAQDHGRVLRLRHLRAGDDREGGRAVALLRLPRRGEGAERCGDVAGPYLDVPRRVPAA